MKTFDDKTEEAKFNAEVDKLRKLVKEPYVALHDLAESFNFLANQVVAIRNRIDEDHEDDKYPLLCQIDEALKEAEDHICGTDIAMAIDHGAWFAKNGWQPSSTMPWLQDESTQKGTQ